MGQVQKHGLFRVLLERFIHEMQRVIGKDIGGIPFLIRVQMIDRFLGTGQDFLVIEKYRAVLEYREIGIDKIVRAVKAIKPAGSG